MRNPDYIIKIAADSVQQLRRSDVERILDNCSNEELQPTADYIIANRPELSIGVHHELDYQTEERAASVNTIF